MQPCGAIVCIELRWLAEALLFLNYIVALAFWPTPTMEAELYSAFLSRFIILEMKYFIDALQKLKHLGQALFQKF
jgi:predicted metal-dependent TIM-barrel fold hydrolase